jgi:hypothetical protein
MSKLSKQVIVMAIVGLVAAIAWSPLPTANAYTDEVYSYTYAPPNLYFSRGGTINGDGAILGTLFAYLTFDGYRHRITMTAGSGLNQLDDCISNAGPAPDGYYGRDDGDPNSGLYFYQKTTGNEDVRGWVWYMYGKRCDGGSTNLRYGLFIHTQDSEPIWIDEYYKSLGCVKINRGDRNFLAAGYRLSYQYWNDRLKVYGNEQ